MGRGKNLADEIADLEQDDRVEAELADLKSEVKDRRRGERTMSEVIPILLITVCLPLWIIFHYITKMKTSKGSVPEDEKMLSEVWESANKMEERINTLERILDIEAPDWRRRS